MGWECVITKNLKKALHRSLSTASEGPPAKSVEGHSPTTPAAERDRASGRDSLSLLERSRKRTAPADERGCHCQGDGPKHGPHLNVSYRGEKGKTTGYYVPKGAEEATREGVAAWQQMQQCLRELAELNKERNLQHAREADSQ